MNRTHRKEPVQPIAQPRGKKGSRTSSLESRLVEAKDSSISEQPKEAKCEQRVHVLDGFLLLEASNVATPEDATRADLSSHNIEVVLTEDFPYFANLCFLDLGGNAVKVEELVGLRALADLRLPCNGIVNIQFGEKGEEPFPYLTKLDLSYNAVAPSAWAAMAKLRRLRELDLSCNQIEEIPAAAKDMAALEHLNLTENRVAGEADLETLSKMPALEKLHLEENLVKTIPSTVEFKKLRWLDLSRNNVECDQDILPLIANASNLATLILIGNPIEAFRFSKVLGHHSSDLSLVSVDQADTSTSRLNVEQSRDIVNLVSDTSLPTLSLDLTKGK